MEIEPTLVSEHLAEIYSKLPGATLEAEEARIRGELADLGGKLVAITEIRETSNEHTIST